MIQYLLLLFKKNQVRIRYDFLCCFNHLLSYSIYAFSCPLSDAIFKYLSLSSLFHSILSPPIMIIPYLYIPFSSPRSAAIYFSASFEFGFETVKNFTL